MVKRNFCSRKGHSSCIPTPLSFIAPFLLFLYLSCPALAKNYNVSEGLFTESLAKKAIFGPKQEVRVYFNLPPYLNPGGLGLKEGFIKFIRGAKKSLRISFYQFNHDEIFQELILAMTKRNIKIFVVTDKMYYFKKGYQDNYEKLREEMIKLGKDPDEYIFYDHTDINSKFHHNKYAIRDLETPKSSSVWLGTWNPTNHGSIENVNIALTVKNSSLAHILSLDFSQYLMGRFQQGKEGIFNVDNKIVTKSLKEIKKLVLKGHKVSYPQVVLANKEGDKTKDRMDIEVLISPKHKGLSKIIQIVQQAKKEILFSTFSMADSMLISSFINKSQHSSSAHEEGKDFNIHSILLKKRPWEKPGIILVKSDSQGKELQEVLWEWTSKSKTPPKRIWKKLAPLIAEIKKSYPRPLNYLTASDTLKSNLKYIYLRSKEGGKVRKVHVEGIFNKKIPNPHLSIDRLVEAQIPISQTTLRGELHNKIILVDEEILIIGSHNFSLNAEDINDEVTLIIKNKKLVLFIKKYFYENTKFFMRPLKIDRSYEDMKIAITEVMAETNHRKKNLNNLDMGEFVELYHYGTKPINLYGAALSDKYFPTHEKYTPAFSTVSGSTSSLVSFRPGKKIGDKGKVIYDSSLTVLQPGKFALVVGRYFHPDIYKKNFIRLFYLVHGRDPTKKDFPLLLTSAHYRSKVLGDTRGINSNDKITLYAPDRYTVIDRFDYPIDLKMYHDENFKKFYMKKNFGLSIEKIKSHFRDFFLDWQENFYYLGNFDQQFIEEYIGKSSPYSRPAEWYIDRGRKGGTPGIMGILSKKEKIYLDTRYD